MTQVNPWIEIIAILTCKLYILPGLSYLTL